MCVQVLRIGRSLHFFLPSSKFSLYLPKQNILMNNFTWYFLLSLSNQKSQKFPTRLLPNHIYGGEFSRNTWMWFPDWSRKGIGFFEYSPFKGGTLGIIGEFSRNEEDPTKYLFCKTWNRQPRARLNYFICFKF